MRDSCRDESVPRPWQRRKSRVSRKDTLDAFRIVAYEIRRNLTKICLASFTQAEACQLARRIKDQRDLIWPMLEWRNSKHGRRLLWLNYRCRQNLIEFAEKAGLNVEILVFK
jgi:hypothetical protein